MAFGNSEKPDELTPHFAAIVALLGEYSFKILQWEEIRIRDRAVLALLIEIHPDHTAPLDEDLQKLATELGIDIASEFQAHHLPQPSSALLSAEVVIAGSAIPSSLASSVMEKISQSGATISNAGSRPHNQISALTLEISIETEDLVELRNSLTELKGPIATNDLRGHGQRLFVFDMDSTLINEEVIDLLAVKSGKGAEVATITESAMRGELDFATSLKKRVALLAGLANSVIDEVRAELTLTPGVQELFSAIHRNGGLIAVVSGGFHNVIDPLLKDLGVDFILANTLETTEAGLTGRISGRLIDGEVKAEFLRETAAHRNIDLSRTVAVGDGANDRAMVTTAGIGVAFCAKPSLVECAETVISERDLSVLIPLLNL